MRFRILISICVAALGGCDHKEEASPRPDAESNPVAEWPATATTTDGNYTVTVTPVEGDVMANKHFSLDVVVKSAGDQPQPGGVRIDADMPAHRHGMNTQPEVTDRGNGRYRVDGMLFHMTGEWVITVKVARGDGVEEAAFGVRID